MKHQESKVEKLSWFATVYGEPASKANSRRLVTSFLGRHRFIKSKKAMNYVDTFLAQVRKPEKPLEGDLVLYCTIYYRTNRPDLDESLIMDCLQKAGVIGNDRQIKEKHIYHAIDKENPRAEIILKYRLACTRKHGLMPTTPKCPRWKR